MTKKKKQTRKKSQQNNQTQSQESKNQPTQDYTTTSRENTPTKSQTITNPIKNDIQIKTVVSEDNSLRNNKTINDNNEDTSSDNKTGLPSIPEAPETTGQAPNQAITPEAAGFIWDLVFNKVAEGKGDYWKLKPSEKETLSNLSVTVANKYLNEIFSQYPDVAGLIIALAIVVIPRFTQLKKEHKKKDEIKPETGTMGDGLNKPFPTK